MKMISLFKLDNFQVPCEKIQGKYSIHTTPGITELKNPYEGHSPPPLSPPLPLGGASCGRFVLLAFCSTDC